MLRSIRVYTSLELEQAVVEKLGRIRDDLVKLVLEAVVLTDTVRIRRLLKSTASRFSYSEDGIDEDCVRV